MHAFIDTYVRGIQQLANTMHRRFEGLVEVHCYIGPRRAEVTLCEKRRGEWKRIEKWVVKGIDKQDRIEQAEGQLEIIQKEMRRACDRAEEIMSLRYVLRDNMQKIDSYARAMRTSGYKQYVSLGHKSKITVKFRAESKSEAVEVSWDKKVIWDDPDSLNAIKGQLEQAIKTIEGVLTNG